MTPFLSSCLIESFPRCFESFIIPTETKKYPKMSNKDPKSIITERNESKFGEMKFGFDASSERPSLVTSLNQRKIRKFCWIMMKTPTKMREIASVEFRILFEVSIK